MSLRTATLGREIFSRMLESFSLDAETTENP